MNGSKHTPTDTRATRSRLHAFGRRCVGATLPLAVLGTAILLAAAGREPAGVELTASTTSGSITIRNSLEGAAVLSTGSMRPGSSVQGVVKITNAGTAAALRLSKSHLSDVLGPFGGALSGRLQLTVEDLARPAAPVVYSGPLSSLPAVALGNFAQGEAHTYRFTATLPNAGQPSSSSTGDNLYQGSSTTVQFDWTATGPGAPVLNFTAPRSQRFAKGVLVRASCTRECKVAIAGSVSIAGSRKTYRLPSRTLSLKASVVTSTTLRFSSAARTAIGKALKKHKKVTANLTGTLPGQAPRGLSIAITRR